MKEVIVFLIFTASTHVQGQEIAPVGTNCYLNDFNESKFPWPASDCLNIEEVFKNYSFAECHLDWPSRLLTVKKTEAGQVVSTRRFKILKGNRLQLIP